MPYRKQIHVTNKCLEEILEYYTFFIVLQGCNIMHKKAKEIKALIPDADSNWVDSCFQICKIKGSFRKVNEGAELSVGVAGVV